MITITATSIPLPQQQDNDDKEKDGADDVGNEEGDDNHQENLSLLKFSFFNLMCLISS